MALGVGCSVADAAYVALGASVGAAVGPAGEAVAGGSGLAHPETTSATKATRRPTAIRLIDPTCPQARAGIARPSMMERRRCCLDVTESDSGSTVDPKRAVSANLDVEPGDRLCRWRGTQLRATRARPSVRTSPDDLSLAVDDEAPERRFLPRRYQNRCSIRPGANLGLWDGCGGEGSGLPRPFRR